MRLGITDKGYKRLQGMPFLADPPIPQSEVYKGIIEFPGFHTTGDFDIAAAYAIGRVLASMTNEGADGTHWVTDYPVVVKLNMEGFEAQTDYDAEKEVKDPLIAAINGLVEYHDISADSEDEDIMEAAYDLSENQDIESDIGSGASPTEYIGESVFYHFQNPLSGIKDEPGFPDFVRTYLTTGELDPQMLMKATNQYRYTEDVDEDRVQAIWYLQPVADEIFDYDAEDANEAELEARWEGFDIPDIDQMYGGMYNSPSELVYGSDEGEGQYHGTTYKRLLQAAPGLAESLPAPSSPPYRGE